MSKPFLTMSCGSCGKSRSVECELIDVPTKAAALEADEGWTHSERGFVVCSLECKAKLDGGLK